LRHFTSFSHFEAAITQNVLDSPFSKIIEFYNEVEEKHVGRASQEI
jgi:hypothetical protein